MENIRHLVDQLLGEMSEPDPQERRVRFAIFHRLLTFYREANDPDAKARIEVYLTETNHLPLDKLAVAVKLVLRTHKYPSMPSIAEIVALARAAAGMDRERYHAGQYLPPARDWPPSGKRWAIEAGRVEALDSPACRPELVAGVAAMLTDRAAQP
jgi:hypothetical protein